MSNPGEEHTISMVSGSPGGSTSSSPQSPLEDKLLTATDTSSGSVAPHEADKPSQAEADYARLARRPSRMEELEEGGSPDSQAGNGAVSETWGEKLLNMAKMGAGMFGDSYDLFVVDSVLAILTEVQKSLPLDQQHANGVDDSSKGAIASATSFGAVGGMLIFGFLSDRLGRRKLMVATVACVAIGCIFCSMTQSSDSFPLASQIIICRVIVGLGIGGEYPLSAANALETGSENSLIHRLLRTAKLFAMQGAGMVTAALLALIFIGVGIPINVVWRLLVALGSIPALIAMYMRIFHMQESAEFVKHRASILEFNLVKPPSIWQQLWEHRWTVLATSSLWFILDVTFYGTGQFRSAIEEKLFADSTAIDSDAARQRLIHLTTFSLIVALAGLPGYLISAFYALKKYDIFMLQMIGFLALSILYLVIGFLVDANAPSTLSLAVFAFTFFVTNLGPNMTTFVIPPLMFPTSMRTTAHGIAAASGKLGAAVGGFALPILLHVWGLPAVMYSCGGVAVFGLIGAYLMQSLPAVAEWRARHNHLEAS